MIYFIRQRTLFKTLIKIGYTSQTISGRLNNIRTDNPNKLDVLLFLDGDRSDEDAYHNMFSKYRLDPKREWFKYGIGLRLFVLLNRYRLGKKVNVEDDFLHDDKNDICETDDVDEFESTNSYIVNSLTVDVIMLYANSDLSARAIAKEYGHSETVRVRAGLIAKHIVDHPGDFEFISKNIEKYKVIKERIDSYKI